MIRREVLRKYGLTLESFLLAFQDHKCALCRTDAHGGVNWAVDHDHETGEVRGLLCLRCNVGLGYFEKTAPYHEAFRAYLAGGLQPFRKLRDAKIERA
jgi:hypothetical protein